MSIRFLSATEWQALRDARLGALSDSPTSFLSIYETEREYHPQQWREELTRGNWLIWPNGDGEPLAVLGALPGADDPAEHYLSFLWVAPHARRNGIGTRLVTEMLDHLRRSGITRAWLWVLEGNEAALALYRKLGFVRTGVRKPLDRDPSRYEERLVCLLG